jgi:hypothetical protein
MLLLRVTENAWVVEIVRKDGAACGGLIAPALRLA